MFWKLSTAVFRHDGRASPHPRIAHTGSSSMASMLNRNRFGAHGDVMGASPSDEAGKTTLLEEIKSRARCVNGGRRVETRTYRQQVAVLGTPPI